jgi:hypothetical protein
LALGSIVNADSELGQRRPHPLGVLLAPPDPEVNVLGKARMPKKGKGVSADDNEVNAVGRE